MAPRPGLRRRSPEQPLHQHRRLGPHRPQAGATSRRRSRHHAGPGFCVSIEHAQFMAKQFTRMGCLPSRCGATARRPNARRRCAIWPTASPRRVLGRPFQRRRRRARRRHRADVASHREPHAVPPTTRSRPAPSEGQDVLHGARLRGHTSSGVPLRSPLPRSPRRHASRRRAAVQQGFPFLPAGCYMQLDDRAPRSCCAACAKRFPPAGRPTSKSYGSSMPPTPTSRCRSTLRSRDSTCPTCTTAHGGGRICAGGGGADRAGRGARSRCGEHWAGCSTSTTTSESPSTGDFWRRRTPRDVSRCQNVGGAWCECS